MSCREWKELVASGDALLRDGSRERASAERHFSICSSCAGRAFLLDPSWAVRRMPDPGFTASEIADLNRSLGNAARMREIESAVAPVRRWRRAAAVAGLVALAALAGLVAVRPNVDRDAALTDARAAETLQTAAGAPGAVDVRPGVSMPAIAGVAPAAARVYELGEDDFALVMVVHETLDL